jgi:hypothetical protein
MNNSDRTMAHFNITIDEQRTMARDVLAGAQFPVSGRLRCPDWDTDVHVELINYHYRGACIRLVENAPMLVNGITHQDIVFDFYLGQRCLKRGMPIRIAWQAFPPKILGIEFLAHAHPCVTRAERYLCHHDIAPYIKSSDPLDANRHLYCKVIDISQSGLLLSTSLTNKHLFPGMLLDDAQLVVPGAPPCTLSLTIENIREAPRDGCFHLGVTVSASGPDYERLVSGYISTMSPGFLQECQEGSTSQARKMRGKRLKHGLTFRVVSSAAGYREVLALRYQGYGAKGKLCKDATVDSQGEGMAQEGILIGAYLAGTLVASMELRFGDVHQPWRTFQVIPREKLTSVNLATTVEINRLVIHPSFQGTDVVLGMIQKAHAIVMAHGGKDILFLATTTLVPLYRKVGCIELGACAPHPHLQGEQLNAMMLTRDAFLKGHFLQPATWEQLYRTTNEYFQKLCGDPHANAFFDTP